MPGCCYDEIYYLHKLWRAPELNQRTHLAAPLEKIHQPQGWPLAVLLLWKKSLEAAETKEKAWSLIGYS